MAAGPGHVMSLRFGKILAAVTNSTAKRFGMSCAAVALLSTAAWGVSEMDQGSLWRQAADRVSQTRANEMGLGVEPMKLRILADCEKKFGVDFYAKQDCMNSELFGGFGEIENAAHQKIEIEYFLAVAVTALLIAVAAWAVGWATLALFVPLCRNYWAWLRRG